jgi:acyl carrier protein
MSLDRSAIENELLELFAHAFRLVKSGVSREQGLAELGVTSLDLVEAIFLV